jgi:hypothetical protein
MSAKVKIATELSIKEESQKDLEIALAELSRTPKAVNQSALLQVYGFLAIQPIDGFRIIEDLKLNLDISYYKCSDYRSIIAELLDLNGIIGNLINGQDRNDQSAQFDILKDLLSDALIHSFYLGFDAWQICKLKG